MRRQTFSNNNNNQPAKCESSSFAHWLSNRAHATFIFEVQQKPAICSQQLIQAEYSTVDLSSCTRNCNTCLPLNPNKSCPIKISTWFRLKQNINKISTVLCFDYFIFQQQQQQKKKHRRNKCKNMHFTCHAIFSGHLLSVFFQIIEHIQYKQTVAK